MQASNPDSAFIQGNVFTTPALSSLAEKIHESSSIYLSHKREYPTKVAELFQKLNRLRELPYNWDSYGAEKPSPAAIRGAQLFLIHHHHLALPFYFLAPGVNGEVMLEFQNQKKAAELYFLNDGQTELILFQDDEVVAETTLDMGFRRLIHFFNS